MTKVFENEAKISKLSRNRTRKNSIANLPILFNKSMIVLLQ